MFIKTDGGKVSSGFTNEHNDCAVRAYTLFTGKSYAEAHATFKSLGRMDRRGTSIAIIMRALADAGFEKRIRGESITLNTLIARHPTGKIYATKRGHAFTVINGSLHDSWKVGGKSRINSYWVDPTPCKSPVPHANLAPRTAPVITAAPTMTSAQKRTAALATWSRLVNYGTLSSYAIAKRIATELNITVANANYYVRSFSK